MQGCSQPKLCNSNDVISTTFYYSKQVIRLSQIQSSRKINSTSSSEKLRFYIAIITMIFCIYFVQPLQKLKFCCPLSNMGTQQINALTVTSNNLWAYTRSNKKCTMESQQTLKVEIKWNKELEDNFLSCLHCPQNIVSHVAGCHSVFKGR